ncbi:replication protein A 32 kDa subunit A isoform X1 [Prunus yedoensis var. nudiflora]|uniref:Replication protein A 32 kDa subunit A isoform X1 n=1 Tax=Prunus yedoensis var. nudiflora TaxID=2094558 RepID=A0A314YH19_PRUYE|nr:replication protein A 32 kDa subunit A isoform X1 [Prunus yedoensis var. nudiflora]
MFSSSQFDSTSAFSGGGFMASQSTQFGDSTPSRAKSRETHGLVPVTVKQISEAHQSGDEKSNFVISGADVANVSVVGMVFDKSERNTDVGFTIDDGTGRIKCRRWVNENFDSREMQEIEDGMYVRVNGHLKVFQGVRQIVAFSVRPVKNFDEVTFHFIECIHTHLQTSKLQLQGNSATQPQSVDSSLSTPVRSGASGYQTAPSNQFSGQVSVDGIKGCDQLVLDYLQQPSSIGKEKGIHRDELSQHLKVPVEKILEAIRSLEEEGLIYSTIDEFHYKSAAYG